RAVPVYIAVRRDKVMQADAGMIRLPVAVLNPGNTVPFTQYSFLQNVFAARGYLAISIQNQLPTDPPMVTKVGQLYVGRLPLMEQGVANIKFALKAMKKVQPDADYDHLTVVGHSLGGDVAMYFAKEYPKRIRTLVTLDNLRVPFVTTGKFKTLSFRSHDPVFKTDPGVIPSDATCKKDGITIVRTDFQHNDMRDTGAQNAKEAIRNVLEKFLSKTDKGGTDAMPMEASAPAPKVLTPGPVPMYVPVPKEYEPSRIWKLISRWHFPKARTEPNTSTLASAGKR
ncbi:MAG: alpha/beta fold hydrolase, partial [Bradyrhizobium sp.]